MCILCLHDAAASKTSSHSDFHPRKRKKDDETSFDRNLLRIEIFFDAT
jgi:hypothetical protein